MNKFLLGVLFIITILIPNHFYLASEEQGHKEKDHICFRTVDKDSDGKVTLEEFIKAFGDNKDKFEAIDQDNDGNLTHDEYHQSLGHGAKKE